MPLRLTAGVEQAPSKAPVRLGPLRKSGGHRGRSQQPAAAGGSHGPPGSSSRHDGNTARRGLDSRLLGPQPEHAYGIDEHPHPGDEVDRRKGQGGGSADVDRTQAGKQTARKADEIESFSHRRGLFWMMPQPEALHAWGRSALIPSKRLPNPCFGREPLNLCVALSLQACRRRSQRARHRGRHSRASWALTSPSTRNPCRPGPL